METAFHSLTAVYMGQAEEREKGGDVGGALDAYQKCLRAADRAGDAPTAAKANFRMGMLYYNQEKWQVSNQGFQTVSSQMCSSAA